jgi:hypothetical protein
MFGTDPPLNSMVHLGSSLEDRGLDMRMSVGDELKIVEIFMIEGT